MFNNAFRCDIIIIYKRHKVNYHICKISSKMERYI